MGIDKGQVQALLDKESATPDELVQMMRDLTSTLIPFFSKNQSLMSETEKKEDELIDSYQKWIDGWRAGNNDKSDYPKIVIVGKQLLKTISDNHLNKHSVVTFSGPTGIGMASGNEADALAVQSKQRAEKENQELKESAAKAAKFVGESIGGIGDVILKLAIAYFVVEALKDTAQKKILRRSY